MTVYRDIPPTAFLNRGYRAAMSYTIDLCYISLIVSWIINDNPHWRTDPPPPLFCPPASGIDNQNVLNEFQPVVTFNSDQSGNWPTSRYRSIARDRWLDPHRHHLTRWLCRPNNYDCLPTRNEWDRKLHWCALMPYTPEKYLKFGFRCS